MIFFRPIQTTFFRGLRPGLIAKKETRIFRSHIARRLRRMANEIESAEPRVRARLTDVPHSASRRGRRRGMPTELDIGPQIQGTDETEVLQPTTGRSRALVGVKGVLMYIADDSLALRER